jgi:CRP-like cAMP-binding protein
MTLVESLRASPIFRDLSPAELALLAPAFRQRTWTRGQVLLTEGQPPGPDSAALFILSGTVAVSARGRGELADLGPGQMIGLIALVDGGPRSATCVAASDQVRTAGLSRHAFDLLHKTNLVLVTRFQYAVATQLARNARRAAEELGV